MRETQEIQVRSLSQEDLLKEEMATHSRILAWKTPWTEQSGGLQSMGSQRIRHDWAHTHAWVCLGFSSSGIQWLKPRLKLSRDDKGVSELGWLLVGLELSFLSTICPTLTCHWLRRKLQTGSSNGRCSVSVGQMTVRGVLFFSFELFLLFWGIGD